MKLRDIALNNLRRRKAKVFFLVVGLLVGVAAVVALLTTTSTLEEDIAHKMDEFAGRHGLHRLVHGRRLPHRGRLLPHRRHAHERAHVLLSSRRATRASSPTAGAESAPIRPVVHGLHAPRYGGVGVGRQGRSRPE